MPCLLCNLLSSCILWSRWIARDCAKQQNCEMFWRTGEQRFYGFPGELTLGIHLWNRRIKKWHFKWLLRLQLQRSWSFWSWQISCLLARRLCLPAFCWLFSELLTLNQPLRDFQMLPLLCWQNSWQSLLRFRKPVLLQPLKRPCSIWPIRAEWRPMCLWSWL